ncbi:MAG TPA: DUF3795 domain-containing protein [Candidatus Omnitrophota bacterium]|nr:DUF3795 domain-containing protein [Candidatus Omnitrophota bacterium]
MKEITADKELIAFCGLYCGACGSYLKGKCPGCKKNEKAGWCQIRVCCFNNKYNSCADCAIMVEPNNCKKFNNLFSKLFALIFKSDRRACIKMIKEQGRDKYAAYMAKEKKQTIKK